MASVVVSGEVYAHVARGLLFSDGSLTLLDPSPSTIWMTSDAAGLGYLPTGAFLDLWADDPSEDRAVSRVQGRLALLDADAQLPGHAALHLSNPRVTTAGLTYDAELVEGLVPAGSGACVLFLQWDTASYEHPPQPSAPSASPR
ncbi:MAG: hypothetical protein WAV00_24655 [Nocardioides sp.]